MFAAVTSRCACCRYVQYFADTLLQPGLQPRKLQLQRVAVTGIPLSDIKDLVVGVWVRPPGAGWKTELLCLAATRPEAMHLEGLHLCPAARLICVFCPTALACASAATLCLLIFGVAIDAGVNALILHLLPKRDYLQKQHSRQSSETASSCCQLLANALSLFLCDKVTTC